MKYFLYFLLNCVISVYINRIGEQVAGDPEFWNLTALLDFYLLHLFLRLQDSAFFFFPSRECVQQIRIWTKTAVYHHFLPLCDQVVW